MRNLVLGQIKTKLTFVVVAIGGANSNYHKISGAQFAKLFQNN